MPGGIALSWLAGFVLLGAWLLRAVRRSRQPEAEAVPRTQVLGAALLVASLAGLAAWAFGIGVAASGRARIRATDGGHAAGAPARARLLLRWVQLHLERADPQASFEALVGYTPDASLRLPRGYGLAEAQRGWDLVRLRAVGTTGLHAEAVAPPEPTSTRVLLTAVPADGGTPLERLAHAARALVDTRTHRCRLPPRPAVDDAAAVAAVLCAGDEPHAAFLFERDLPWKDAAPERVPVRVAPFLWQDGSFRAHSLQIATGTLVQMGAVADAVPGLTLWELPAPAGRTELFFPPRDLGAPCAEWTRGAGGFLGGEPTGPPAESTREDESSACVLPFTPPFGLEVRRLVPAQAAIAARSLWAAGLLAAPGLLALALLATRPRGEMGPRRFARLLGLSWAAGFLGALAVTRLLWAHRIDVLRRYEAVGPLVLENQAFVVLAAATLGATAVLAWYEPPRAGRALAQAALAWVAFVAVGAWALLPDARPLLSAEDAAKLVLQALLSLGLGTLPAWWPTVRDRLGRIRMPMGAICALLSVAAVAALARHQLGVLPKLACAWAYVFLLYAGLRTSIGSGRARALVTGAAAVGGAALLYGDTGVALAIAGPGALGALVLASHDASYQEDQARTLDGYQRHAPLVRLHAALVAALGLLLLGWGAWTLLASLRAGEPDGTPARSFTEAALHLPLFAAALLAAVALHAWRRRERARAGRWLVLALALGLAWAGRGFLVGRTLDTQTRAARRLALVLDPAYALLSSDRDFQRGLAAWNETRLPAPASASAPAPHADLAGGQGYFGAQIADSGVRRAIDNDYLPVLMLREVGLGGLALVVLAYLALIGFAAVLASERFRDGSYAQRARLLAALVLGTLCVYQPLASVGVLPLTGIAWPGLGLNSPTDFWLFVALALMFACWGGSAAPETALERFDHELRALVVHRRTRRLASAASLALAAGCALVAVRAGAFALRRPMPLRATPDGRVELVAPFEALSDAVDYVSRLHCDPPGAELLPRDIRGDPATTEGLRRFHAAFARAWRGEHDAARRLAREFVETGRCGPGVGRWTAEPAPDGDECRLGFKFGWPEVRLAVARRGDGRTAQCEIEARPEPLRALRPPARAVEGERIRLASRARGAAAGDLGELIGGGVVVRLRPPPAGARRPPSPLSATTAASGFYFASEVVLSDDLKLVAREGAVRLLHRGAAHREREPAWLVVRQAPAERIAETEEGAWSVHAIGERKDAIPLEGLALVVTGRARGRTVWLFRPAVRHGGDRAPTADPLLADDVATAAGRRWRHYVYGGLLPELGWVNPYQSRLSLGLDGWVHLAVAEHEKAAALAHLPSGGGPAPRGPAAALRDFEAAWCGTLRPLPEPSSDPYPSVCARSPLDGVLECRVSLQPELETRLRHLLELASLAPALFPRPASGRPARPAQHAELVLQAGDTGELLARADFAPGRESTAYAPRTLEIEQHLIRLREGRDPATGRKLARTGEPSALKADWSQRVAVGSTMKPLLARALERADPQLAQNLRLDAPDRPTHGECPGGWPPLLGHCPPTRSIWDEGRAGADLTQYLSESLNWFQAAVGLLGTAAPGGSFGFGADGAAQSPAELTWLRLDQWPRSAPLWTRTASGRTVVSAESTIDVEALRETPMWRELEALLGRPLCTGPGKRACERASERGDVCAARALPIRSPSRDLRHLVALGPSDFDFVPERPSGRVALTEYFQFLRGSGVHPLGSLMQLADAFNRLFYERAPSAGGAYRLAASWFPVAAAGSAPPWSCAEPAQLDGAMRGLCDAFTAPHGTARTLEPLLHDEHLVVYGAKTGTIDALRDLAERRAACESYGRSHTVPGTTSQPYQLPCGAASRQDINDSLIVVAFGVRAGGEIVPLTLALRFQGAGQGYATAVARSFIDAIRDYFVAPAGPSLAQAGPR